MWSEQLTHYVPPGVQSSLTDLKKVTLFLNFIVDSGGVVILCWLVF